ncbi:MAG: hypothetical protein V4502_02350 [Pseudomonadota bacterium]
MARENVPIRDVILRLSLPFQQCGVTLRGMLLLVAAAMAVATAPPALPATSRVVAQATATVRIISAVRLKLDAEHNDGAPRARATVFVSNGTAQPARLIEFQ